MYKIIVLLSQVCDKAKEAISIMGKINELIKGTSCEGQITFIFPEVTMFGKDEEKS